MRKNRSLNPLVYNRLQRMNMKKRMIDLLEKEGEGILQKCLNNISLYELKNETIKEITQQVLQSSDTDHQVKKAISTLNRRIFVFQYPSDGLLIKGYLSLVPNPSSNPLLVLLRGGNRLFGLPHPASDLSCCHPFNTLATLYRGGICEGKDEYGGRDVHDVFHLFQFIPFLEKKLNISLGKHTYMLGTSRGAMQLFLSLARFPQLQESVTKAVSLSGLLDMELTLKDRPDLKQMFCEDYGLIEGSNEKEWLETRDPIQAVKSIRKDLPFLIIQGTADKRTSLEEGYHMLQKLQKRGHPVTYWEIQGGNHCLNNQKDRMAMIMDWLNLSPG